jgi:hypothetical protein
MTLGLAFGAVNTNFTFGPAQAFEHVFDTVHQSVTNGGAFINNEWVSSVALAAVLHQEYTECC